MDAAPSAPARADGARDGGAPQGTPEPASGAPDIRPDVGAQVIHAPRLECVPTAAGRMLAPFARVFLLASLLAAWIDAVSGAGARAVYVLVPGVLLWAVHALSPWLARAQLAHLSVELEPVLCEHVGALLSFHARLLHAGTRWAARDVSVAVGHARRGPLRVAGHAACVAPLESASVACAFSPVRRGRFDRLRMTLATSFPFGLCQARLFLEPPVELIVLPRRRASAAAWPHAAASAGERAAARRARGDVDLRGLREWRPGDDLHHLHWKVSARRGKWILREFAGSERARVHLVVVCDVPAAARRPGAAVAARAATGDDFGHPGFERTVEWCANVAQAWLRDGCSVRTTAIADEPAPGPQAVRRGQASELWDFFAELAPRRCSDAGRRAARHCARLIEQSRARGEACVLAHAGLEELAELRHVAHVVDAHPPEEPWRAAATGEDL